MSARDQAGIALGWASLALLTVALIGYLGNNTLVLWVKIVLGLGVALGVAYLAIRREAAAAVILSPNAAYRANATLFILSVVGILVLVNYIASRHYRKFDLTKSQRFTLAPQTREVVKNLKEEVTITAFYQMGGRGAREGMQARDLLRQYKDLSPKVKVEVIDPTADPAKALSKGVTSIPVIWFESGGRKEQAYTVGEQEVTSAILKVTRPEKKKIYFLFGHGEHDVDSYERDGMSDARSELEKMNYEVSKLVLQTVREVPRDAALIVVAGPKKGIPDDEQKMLAGYLEQGGKMLLLLDPMAPVPDQLVRPWGIEVGDNVVIDSRLQPGLAVVEKFEFHQITKNLQTGVFLLARSVTAAASPPSGVTVTPLAKTGDLAWGETKMNGPFERDSADLSGPVTVGVVVQKEHTTDSPNQTDDKKKSTRLVVFGDSDFGTRQLFLAMNTSGADLFLNSVNWLAEEEALVNIRPKEPESNTVTLVGSQSRWIFLFTVVIVPVAVLGSGVAVWWRRR